MENTAGEGIIRFDKENLVSSVAIETVIIIVIGGFSAEFSNVIGS